MYRIDGEDTKIEFTDGTNQVMLPGDATDVWIRSGNNHSTNGRTNNTVFTRTSEGSREARTVAAKLIARDRALRGKGARWKGHDE